MCLLHAGVDSALPFWTAAISRTFFFFSSNPNTWSHRQSNAKWHFPLLQAACALVFQVTHFHFSCLDCTGKTFHLPITHRSSREIVKKSHSLVISRTQKIKEGTVTIGTALCRINFNFTGVFFFFFLSFQGYFALDVLVSKRATQTTHLVSVSFILDSWSEPGVLTCQQGCNPIVTLWSASAPSLGKQFSEPNTTGVNRGTINGVSIMTHFSDPAKEPCSLQQHHRILGGRLSCICLMAIIHKTNKQNVASEWNCEDRDRWPVGEPETSANHPSERGEREEGERVGESGRGERVRAEKRDKRRWNRGGGEKERKCGSNKYGGRRRGGGVRWGSDRLDSVGG